VSLLQGFDRVVNVYMFTHLVPGPTTYREQQPGGSDGLLEMGIPHPAVVIGPPAMMT
jgi:hypothetical protein